jgi:hypothetical protein
MVLASPPRHKQSLISKAKKQSDDGQEIIHTEFVPSG